MLDNISNVKRSFEQRHFQTNSDPLTLNIQRVQRDTSNASMEHEQSRSSKVDGFMQDATSWQLTMGAAAVDDYLASFLD